MYPEKINVRNRDDSKGSGKNNGEWKVTAAVITPSNESILTDDKKKVVEQIKHLQAYLSCLCQEENCGTSNDNQALATIHGQGINSNVEWIIDSVATHHIIGTQSYFININYRREKNKFRWQMGQKFPLQVMDPLTLWISISHMIFYMF